MIVTKELVVSGRKKADIVADLRKKEFRPFSKVKKAKAAGETEDVVELDAELGIAWYVRTGSCSTMDFGARQRRRRMRERKSSRA